MTIKFYVQKIEFSDEKGKKYGGNNNIFGIFRKWSNIIITILPIFLFITVCTPSNMIKNCDSEMPRREAPTI